MASCILTIGGTTGSVLIEYDLTSNHHYLTAYPGDPVYIDTTSTNVTYKVLEGDASVSSGCLTITSVVEICYSINWETDLLSANTPPKNFTKLILGASEFAISANYNSNVANLAEQINALNNNIIRASSSIGTGTTRNTINNDLILKVKGLLVPEVQVTNVDYPHKFYIKGEVTATCVPLTYQSYLDECIPINQIAN